MPSALAARKAALAAQAQAAKAAPSPPKVRTPSIVRSPSLSLSEDDVPGPSKRRKISKKTARYFAPESVEEVEDIREVKKRNRKFSPSAPASEADDGMADSSEEEEEVSSVGEEVDEGRAVWAAPPVSRTGNVKAASVGSKFKPASGVNVALVTDEQLAECGITGEGSGVVISLGKQEVSWPSHSDTSVTYIPVGDACWSLHYTTTTKWPRHLIYNAISLVPPNTGIWPFFPPDSSHYPFVDQEAPTSI